MRILIAGSTYAPSINGQAVFTTNLAQGLAARGHQVGMAVQSERSRPYRQMRNGVDVHGVWSVSVGMFYPGIHISPLTAGPAKRIIEQLRPEIVHIQDHFTLAREMYFAARRAGVRVVGTNHFMPENLGPYIPAPLGLRSLVYQAFWRHMLALYCRLDAVTAPSRTAAAILHRQGLAKPVYPISCGVDFERFRLQPQVKRAEIRQRYRIDENTTAFLYVGRVDGEKRLDVLMAALKLLDRQDIQLVIAGKGAALEATRQMAQQMGLGRRVVFTGHVPAEDLPALLNSADVFTIASQAELLSIATLEAMACARPVLLARSQALAELVIDGVNGFGFRPGDPADAARWMAALANQPESWPAMGQASLELVRPHRLENTLRLYEDIYEALLAHKPAPQADFLPERIRPLRNFILRAMSQLWQ